MGTPFNPPGEWRQVARKGDDPYWQYLSPGYAVYGTVVPSKTRSGMFEWDARVMFPCEGRDDRNPNGKVPTLEQVQRIVEVVCECTATAAPAPPKELVVVVPAGDTTIADAMSVLDGV